jgi:hypothetical protein
MAAAAEKIREGTGTVEEGSYERCGNLGFS